MSSARPSTSSLDLPPPQTFDILPALHELLARLQLPPPPGPPPIDHDDTLPDGTSADLGVYYSELQPLNPKDLSVEALYIKSRIRNALKALEKLPDMDRSMEDQQKELESLKGKIERQRRMLQALGQSASTVLTSL